MSSKPRVSSGGTIFWETSDGRWHRDGNKPAIIRPNGTIEFWVNDHFVTIRFQDQ